MKVKRIELNKTKYSTRASQSIFQSGVGAMVDFADQTLMTAAPKYWQGSIEEIHDPRLEKALHVDFFGMPKESREGIGYVRFPEWYLCPVCRRFMPIDQWVEEYSKYASEKTKMYDRYMTKRPFCYKCHSNLVAANIITICNNGHISDFPWVEWAHAKSYPPKEVCASPKMKLRTSASVAEGLQGLVIQCENCGASATLKEAFYPEVFDKLIEDGHTEFCCKGAHPWKFKNEKCNETPVTKQRGDTSVYFSNTVSSIVIPVYRDKLENEVRNSKAFYKHKLVLDEFDTIDEKKNFYNKKKDQWNKEIANELLKDKNQISRIADNLVMGSFSYDENDGIVDEINDVEYRYEEYRVLCGLDGDIDDTDDFLREEMNVADYSIPGIDKVVLVKKLREVCALTGFSRVKPVSGDGDGSKLVTIKDPNLNWYPGYEVRGEGVFLSFDGKALDKWADTDFVQNRAGILSRNFAESAFARNFEMEVSPQKTLLHTLAHLLIKQLSFECGYSVASLKERIYYNNDGSDKNMSGILIYTASGDSEGTLGGLVIQGRADCLPRIFRSAVEKARMCSCDPVCITSEGQGREGLNLAACHSCALLPETSCEMFNVMLDRGLVIGTFENPYGGFYSEWVMGVSGHDIKMPQHVSNESRENRAEDVVKVLDDGSHLTYHKPNEIWDYILQDSEDDRDIELFKKLKDKNMTRLSDTIYEGVLRVDDVDINVDLMWPEKKTLFFLCENQEDYKCIEHKLDWNIYCNALKKIDVDEFVKSVEK